MRVCVAHDVMYLVDCSSVIFYKRSETEVFPVVILVLF